MSQRYSYLCLKQFDMDVFNSDWISMGREDIIKNKNLLDTACKYAYYVCLCMCNHKLYLWKVIFSRNVWIFRQRKEKEFLIFVVSIVVINFWYQLTFYSITKFLTQFFLRVKKNKMGLILYNMYNYTL